MRSVCTITFERRTCNMSNNKKALMKFMFPNKEAAAKFLRLIQGWEHVTSCQTPRSHNESSMEDQVWVCGTGSILFDMRLETQLIEAAEKEGGAKIA